MWARPAYRSGPHCVQRFPVAVAQWPQQLRSPTVQALTSSIATLYLHPSPDLQGALQDPGDWEVQTRGRPVLLRWGVEDGGDSSKRAESVSTSDTLCLHVAAREPIDRQ
ncbi:hypothetical protein GCM10018980_22630 [Streptomyces capoamus]|uniref:Uncharacterized protein n=1 Tax=Streptomyces capoamus TaxID=68183 RepID=A0A919C2Z5_9ACTN|nr:hypothetical protein GCM10010501_01270 [Streptomyces libani subsp. rufus]GHG44580.1 hypothetical protein GCM10018980_22630 [Streptomyces capoamus]